MIAVDVRICLTGVIALGVTALGMLAAGCAQRVAPTPAVEPIANLVERDAGEDWRPGSLAVREVLPRLEVAATRESWNIGDRVIIEIVSNSVATSTRRYLHIELLSEYADADPKAFQTKSSAGKRPFAFSSPTVATRITVYDDLGAIVDTSTGRFPLNLLGYGPYDGCTPIATRPELRGQKSIVMPDLPEHEHERMMRGWMALFGFSGSMNRRGPFKDLLKGLIARPSLLAMVLRPSVQVTFGENDWPEFLPDWTEAGKSVRVIRVPLQLRIADQPALVGEMIACEPLAPLSLCGGLLRATGRNPVDPRVSVELRLVGSALGSGGQMFSAATTVPVKD
ncbi:MAG: hypothetical protein K2W85_09090 [Phycisphaerales bacterium]|nr:hypothetical protein [Phycisphaerales bacterium]